jgi:RNA recognition motif-containing protein
MPDDTAGITHSSNVPKTMCCQQMQLADPEMQPDSSVYVQDQDQRQQQQSAPSTAAAAASGGVMTDSGKAAYTSSIQQESEEQHDEQQLFALLLSGVPTSYTEAELLPLLQQVGTARDASSSCTQPSGIKALQRKLQQQSQNIVYMFRDIQRHAGCVSGWQYGQLYPDFATHRKSMQCQLQCSICSVLPPTANTAYFAVAAATAAAAAAVESLQHGEVAACSVLRDRSSGQSLGGALLSYSSKQAADSALQALQTLQLPGAERPLEVSVLGSAALLAL